MTRAVGRHNSEMRGMHLVVMAKPIRRTQQGVLDFLEQLKAEDNHITRNWQEVGLTVENAGDSQALIQLKNEYCDRRDCLRCRFGYEYLKGVRR